MSYDKELTKQILGDPGPLRFNPWVIKVCQGCHKPEKVRYHGAKRPTADYYCRSCVVNRPAVKAKLSDSTSKQWEDPEFRKLVVNNSTTIWNDPDRREQMSAFRNSPDFQARMAEINRTKLYDAAKIARNMQRLWRDPAYRARAIAAMSVNSTALWQDKSYRERIASATRHSWTIPEYRAKMTAILIDSRQSMPRVSAIQDVLYSILDDFGVQYYREYADKAADEQCHMGPYSFDCVIPRAGRSTLLIECQGDYWHSLDKVVHRDRAKAQYIANNFSATHELKYLWEHEFMSSDKVKSVLAYWLGLGELESIEYRLDDLVVREAAIDDSIDILSKYHYLPNTGRGGIRVGAYFGTTLVALAVFSPLSRQNLPYDYDSVRELSRFCIHPRYRVPNLGTWFMSRAIDSLQSKYHTIISYCDTTFNHSGGLYRAANFRLDGETSPDYWYSTPDGWAIHKKTLYKHAVRMHFTEAEYAEHMGYKKIWGCSKLRFIYRRD